MQRRRNRLPGAPYVYVAEKDGREIAECGTAVAAAYEYAVRVLKRTPLALEYHPPAEVAEPAEAPAEEVGEMRLLLMPPTLAISPTSSSATTAGRGTATPATCGA